VCYIGKCLEEKTVYAANTYKTPIKSFSGDDGNPATTEKFSNFKLKNLPHIVQTAPSKLLENNDPLDRYREEDIDANSDDAISKNNLREKIYLARKLENLKNTISNLYKESDGKIFSL
jgi:hypothetical protein